MGKTRDSAESYCSNEQVSIVLDIAPINNVESFAFQAQLTSVHSHKENAFINKLASSRPSRDQGKLDRLWISGDRKGSVIHSLWSRSNRGCLSSL